MPLATQTVEWLECKECGFKTAQSKRPLDKYNKDW